MSHPVGSGVAVLPRRGWATLRRWSVVFVGLTLLFGAVWHYRLDPGTGFAALMEAVTLAGLALSVVAIGVGVARDDGHPWHVSTTLRFCVLGAAAALLLSGWIALVVHVPEFAVRDLSFVTLTMTSVGGSVGAFFGVNYDRLRRRTTALVDRDNRLDEFVGIVSHDLRNPLNSAQGHLERARETGDAHHFDAVARAHAQMERLLREISALARAPDEPAVAGELAPVRPVLMSRLATDVWADLDADGARLEVRFDGHLNAEEQRLRTLLGHLFRNAVEHGGEDVTVVVGPMEDGFYVEDDGPGIPMDRRELVWRGGVTAVADNPGFGLAIVRRIAEAHCWHSRVVESDSGGARIEFTGVETVPTGEASTGLPSLSL